MYFVSNAPRLPSPLEPLDDDRLDAAGIRMFLKRDDLIHPDFPGNKWRKLKHNLAAAAGRPILTFGGAYSGHLQATAAAGHHFGFPTIGVIRGEEHGPLNPVLARASSHGMTLHYVSRRQYRDKSDPAFVAALRARFGDFYLIPEGGANPEALRGCAELPAEIEPHFDVLCCSSGTGATLAGIATALRPAQRAIGYAALKPGDFLNDEVRRLQQSYGHPTANWSIETSSHFGGYARRTPPLDAFIADFQERHNITLNWVYEAKMMSTLFTRIGAGEFPPGTALVALLA